MDKAKQNKQTDKQFEEARAWTKQNKENQSDEQTKINKPRNEHNQTKEKQTNEQPI